MAQIRLTVEAVPAVAVVHELATGCRVDLAFEIHNGSSWELELVAVEEDVYAADGSLLQRRSVGGDMRIGPGERRTLANPLPELSPGIPLVALVYRFAFGTAAGGLLHVTVPVRAIEPAAPAQSEPTPSPTPRQLARAWFETLWTLGVYSPAPAHP